MLKRAFLVGLSGLVLSFFSLEPIADMNLPSIAQVPVAQAQAVCFGIRGIGGCVGQPRRTYRTKRRTYNNRRTTTRSKRSSIVRDDANIQRALNAFGFNAGSPDGLFGRKTKAAIRSYQGSIGAKQTGTLTTQQRATLLTQYARLISGPPNDNSNTTADNKRAPGIVAPSQTASFLKSLRDQAPPDTRSDSGPITIAALCDNDTSRENTGGTEINLAGSDANSLFVEQFCTARSYVLRELQESLQSTSDSEAAGIWGQCSDHAVARESDLAVLAGNSATGFIQELSPSILPNTNDREALLDSSELCLGLSHAFDNAQAALLYASYMVVLGDEAYGELIGEQFGLGLGIEQDKSRAAEWLNWTADELDQGAVPFVQVDDYDPSPLLRAMASYSDSLGKDPTSLVADGSNSQPSTGLLLPGLQRDSKDGERARDSFVMRKSMAPLEIVLDMTPDEMRQHCADPDSQGNSILALKICRAVVYAAGDSDLMNVYDQRLQASADWPRSRAQLNLRDSGTDFAANR